MKNHSQQTCTSQSSYFKHGEKNFKCEIATKKEILVNFWISKTIETGGICRTDRLFHRDMEYNDEWENSEHYWFACLGFLLPIFLYHYVQEKSFTFPPVRTWASYCSSESLCDTQPETCNSSSSSVCLKVRVSFNAMVAESFSMTQKYRKQSYPHLCAHIWKTCTNPRKPEWLLNMFNLIKLVALVAYITSNN